MSHHSRHTTPRILTVDADAIDEAKLMEAARALWDKKLVAFPTETVYGLGALGLEPVAVRRIFAAKERPAQNPLILHVLDTEHAKPLVLEWSAHASALAKAFWPGPMTLVLKRAPCVPDEVTAHGDSVGVRVPAHPVAHALLKLVDAPIAAPSANLYTQVSPTLASHVIDSLGPRVDVVVDAGGTQVGLESTVISLLGDVPTILRPGMITLGDVRHVVPHARYGEGIDAQEVMRSPGLARKHYAPKARVILTRASPTMHGPHVAWMTLSTHDDVDFDGFCLVLGKDPHVYATRFYEALHQCDARGCTVVFIEEPPQHEDTWRAIWDRLERARTQGFE